MVFYPFKIRLPRRKYREKTKDKKEQHKQCATYQKYAPIRKNKRKKGVKQLLATWDGEHIWHLLLDRY